MAYLALVLAVGFSLFTVGEARPESGAETSAGPSSAEGRAALSLRSMRPLTIAGRGFKPRERVRVRVIGVGTKTIVASARGSFVVRMRYADPCASRRVVAIGSRGSRASLNLSHLLCVDP